MTKTLEKKINKFKHHIGMTEETKIRFDQLLYYSNLRSADELLNKLIDSFIDKNHITQEDLTKKRRLR